MNILEIAKILIGLMLIFFIPGYFVTRLFYQKVKGLKLIAFVCGISISITIIIGLILAAMHLFNYWNSIIGYVLILGIITGYYYLKKAI
jgi:uncharacterized membrane protein